MDNEIRLVELQNEVEALNITNDEELENANKLAKKNNGFIKEIKAKHKPIVAAAFQEHKKAKADEKAELEPYEKIAAIIKKAIGDYHKKVLEPRKKELKRIQQEELDFIGEIITQEEEKPSMAGNYVRKTWQARITDESKVPVAINNIIIRPVDIRKLNDIAKQSEGKAEIPGVEFYQKETVVIK